jgi:hypothetical protein
MGGQAESDKSIYLDSAEFEKVNDPYEGDNKVPDMGLSQDSSIRINLAAQIHCQFTLFELCQLPRLIIDGK